MDIKQFAFLKYSLRSRRHVYLDHNATTNVSSQVRRRMNQVLKHNFGNPSALYEIARKSAKIMEKARQQLAEAIHAMPDEIYFTGCATESNNAVLKSVSLHFYPKKNKIISTPIEHPSVINTLDFLKTSGIVVEYCPVDRKGRVSPDELEKLIDEDTFLICCMLANNEIGTIQDIRAISKIAHQKGVLVLSDCVINSPEEDCLQNTIRITFPNVNSAGLMAILFDEQTYILDVRPQLQRRNLKSLPNSHEASFFQIEKFLNQLPKDKNILVVCQHGTFSFITAYYLKSKGFKQVSNLLSGLTGVKMRRNELYQKYSGQNVMVLKPAS
jgi:rhodanese-related sulfurtransferase